MALGAHIARVGLDTSEDRDPTFMGWRNKLAARDFSSLLELAVTGESQCFGGPAEVVIV